MEQQDRIKGFLAKGTDTNTLEGTLKIWVAKTMDGELQNEMSQTLEDQYGIKRIPKKRYVVRHLRPILATAASLALLVSLLMINKNTVTANTRAMQYLNAQSIQHPGAFKGIAKADANRTKGILAFNKGDFGKATLAFRAITAPNEEDRHYLGLSYLKNGQYQKAIEKLEMGTSKTSRFQEEASWFLALAYLLDGNDEQARYWLKQIGREEWNYNEAQELLNELENE